MRTALLVLGLLALLTGLVWIGQGTGYFPYPRQSFMIGETRWAWIGLAVAACGVMAIAASRFVRP